MSRALAAGAVVLALAGAAYLGRAAALRPPAVGGWPVPDFALKDDRGRTVTRADLAGKPWVAAFIYASCGSQCPMMTAKMKSLRARLPDARFVTFSVDSADTPERLAAYKKTNGADWLFLTGAKGEVQALCKTGFKLAVADGTDEKDPIIHSDKLVLVDASGKVKGFYDPSEPARLSELAEAIR